MIKRILTISLLSVMLLLSGCGDSEGEDRLETQQMLDDGDFSGVISKVESKSVKDNKDYLVLAAAYMGKAGLSLPDIVNIVASSDDEGDEFYNLINKFYNRSSYTALSDIEKSGNYYK